MHKTIVVVDTHDLIFENDHLSIITFEQYLADYPKRNEPKTRLINLCDTEHYLSRGYYCSLLAEARQHKVLPSVSTINDLRDLSNDTSAGLQFAVPAELISSVPQDESIEFLVFMGWVGHEPWKKLAKQLFEKYPAPILHFSLSKDSNGVLLQVKRHSFINLSKADQVLFLERLNVFTERVWRTPTARKKQRWDMAILVNPNEEQPPSDKDAIKLFIKAAAKVGIHAETITAEQGSQISQYDALFIRETTAIDHHTYRLARKAEREGLVVIDDSASILRCCNKVFLHDAFSYNGVPAPKTHVVIGDSEQDLDHIESSFSYPIVLKMPEGSFSKGVFKVKTREELKLKLQELLVDTALVLVQEYLYTDYDWRIGVLNGRAIYACRYHMVRDHWQIYNHGNQKSESGGFETLPTFEVPKSVLDAALKACAMIGRGLYGVDIKHKDNQVYVIEVNDNPSIDHEVEDLYLGNELYMLIMQEFVSRLEQRGR
ncbi:RimK family protein [Neptunomonas antarctica]|uniref:Glutathione synthase/RimK-type ligase, ATP-grasp superfamily n=1 Tax=Neptunomonas antarctica TaxID=619304 RepID=A0A1N7J5C2_9GAMM|nr:RimK family protein [Neptunomonas antarctica]SIS44436.1 Glutathione synthase/RimK-type ligase, ATP-grasp superfamily [Neptunomonas antarctica]